MTALIDVIGAEFKRLGEEGPAAAEVGRAKAQLKAGLLMSLESSSARAEQMARHLLIHGRLIGSDELIRNVEDVDAGRIRSCAATMTLSTPSVAVVGAGRRSHDHAAHAVNLSWN